MQLQQVQYCNISKDTHNLTWKHFSFFKRYTKGVQFLAKCYTKLFWDPPSPRGGNTAPQTESETRMQFTPIRYSYLL